MYTWVALSVLVAWGTFNQTGGWRRVYRVATAAGAGFITLLLGLYIAEALLRIYYWVSNQWEGSHWPFYGYLWPHEATAVAGSLIAAAVVWFSLRKWFAHRGRVAVQRESDATARD